MTEDELDQLHLEYRKALKAFSEADALMDRLSQSIGAISRNLSDSQAGKQGRAPLADRQREQILSMTSPADIIASHDDWNTKRGHLGNIWQKFPKEDQKALKPPPKNAGYFF